MEGFIIKSVSGIFYVHCYDDNNDYKCSIVGKYRNDKIKPLSGDEVSFEYDSKQNYAQIVEIKKRKNELVRPLVANIDLGLIVMSTIKPKFDSYLVDKLIVTLTRQNIEPVIIVSKCEYLDDDLKSLLENYKLAGYIVIEISSHENINIDKVEKLIENKKVCLCGQSAVGKSSLINSLLKDTKQDVGSYSEKLGRGRHETREVEYIKVGNGYVADSPGFSSLEIKMDLVDYSKSFKDFEKLSHNCRFNTCIHKNEPGCAIKKAVDDGIIDSRRYENYLHLLSEIKDGRHVWVKKQKERH